MFKIEISSNIHLELLQLCHSSELYALTEANREYLKEWLPWLNHSKSEDDTKSFIKSTMQQFSDDLGFQVAILFNNKIVGITGFHPINKVNHYGSLGYWLSKDHQGCGLMTKANAKIIELGFKDLGLNKIIIPCAFDNKKSRAVAVRLGLKQDGVLRQHEWLYDRYVDIVIYSILKSEFNMWVGLNAVKDY